MGLLRLEKRQGQWELIQGERLQLARWRLEGSGRVVSRLASGREREVNPADVPIDVAVALLAMRDAAAFAAGHPGETICGPAALDRWLVASRDALVRGRFAAGGAAASWSTFRAMFEAAVKAIHVTAAC